MKKKLMLLTTFIFALLIGVCSVGRKEVKAAGENCQTYNNYYMLLDSTSRGWFDDNVDANGEVTRATSKTFYIGKPSNAVETYRGYMDISDDGADNSMTLKEFYDYFSLARNEDDEVYENGRDAYATAVVWYDASGNLQTGSYPWMEFDEFEERVPSGLYRIAPEQNIDASVDVMATQVNINRKWYYEDIEALGLAERTDVVQSPAVYRVEYEVCEEVEEEYTLTINFGTNKTCTEGTDIKSPVTSKHNAGEAVNYSIPNELGDYGFSEVGKVSVSSLVTTVRNNALSFNMPAQDTTVCLVYVKSPQTGLGWIYFAWIVAIGALAYSVWYFIKYSKTRNSEV